MSTFGVIFDMDGVLVDSYRAHHQSWQAVAVKRGLTMSEQDFARTFGRTSREIIQQLWPGQFDDAEIRRFDQDKEQAYRDILQSHFPEMSGASDLLAALHGAGFRLAIGSSGPAENVQVVQRCLRNAQLLSAVVHGGEVNHGKPDPEVFLVAARKLGLEPGDCAVVEDAPVGVEAARRAGMVAIGLVGTAPRVALSQRATMVIDSLRELTPEFIQHIIEENKKPRRPSP